MPKKKNEYPEVDDRWSKQVQEEWYAIWEDLEWAKNIRAELHIPTLRRLYTYKNRWYELNDEMYGQPKLIRGSRGEGHMVKNPLMAELRELEDTILRMEKEFGMTLRSASLIDLDLGQGAKTWAELQQLDKQNSKVMNAAKERSALPVVSEVID